jgi:cation diffusion facilitator CzcD-associated flavoprotein CzcO
MAPIKSIAIIGAGPAGAIAVDALAQEREFIQSGYLREERRLEDVW